jgi:hypothetical protein
MKIDVVGKDNFPGGITRKLATQEPLEEEIELPIQPGVEALEGVLKILTEGVSIAGETVGVAGGNGSVGNGLGEESRGTAVTEVADANRGESEGSEPQAAPIKVQSILSRRQCTDLTPPFVQIVALSLSLIH